MSGTHFRRQAPIGPYVVDFFCPAAHLIIELDGGHHNEEETAQKDRARQLWLEREGYRVIRFWNSDVNSNLEGVLEQIYIELYGSRDAEAVCTSSISDIRDSAARPHPGRLRRPTLPLQGRVKKTSLPSFQAR